jgi:hypothetical protein
MSDSDLIHCQGAGTTDDGSTSARQVRHLTQADLARRWRKSQRTLEGWRLRGEGPPHLWIGGVLYRLEDVEAFEKLHLRQKATRRSRSRPSSTAGATP